MDHLHHDHPQSELDENKYSKIDPAKILLLPLLLNLFFTFLEFGGVYISKSAAIFSDSFHDLGDTLSILALWILNRISVKKADKRYTFGYKRFSLLGAIITSMTLIIGSIFAIREAIGRFFAPVEVSGKWVFIIALVGITINGISVLWLRYKKYKGGMSEKVVTLHLLEDMVGWIGVLITGIILLFIDFPLIDTIMSLILSAYILYKATRYVIEIFRILLLINPSDLDAEELVGKLITLEGVKNIHDLHIWSLDGINNIITLHVVTDYCEMEEMEKLKAKIKEYLSNIAIHCTIEMESPCCSCNYSDSAYCID